MEGLKNMKIVLIETKKYNSLFVQKNLCSFVELLLNRLSKNI